jgi:hypothetical protein
MDIVVPYESDLFVVPKQAHRWALEKVKIWQDAAFGLKPEGDAWTASASGSETAPGDQVLTLVGEHGAGKTWLLRYLAETEHRASSTAVYLDLARRSDYPRPADYVGAIESEVRSKCGDENTMLLLDSVPAHLDEHLRTLEDSILRPHLTHRSSLVMMALVHPSHVCWRAPALRGGQRYDLPPFDESETRDQLQRLTKAMPIQKGMEPSRLQAASGGLPLLSYLLATREQTEAFGLLLEYWFFRIPLDERERVRNYLEAVCVLDVLEHASIQRALEVYAHHKPDAVGFPAHAGGVRNILRKYWLSRPFPDSPGRIVLVESVRRAAEQILETRDAELYSQLRTVAQATSERLR